MSLSDKDSILKAIYDNPDEDTPKLQYVDWVKDWMKRNKNWETMKELV